MVAKQSCSRILALIFSPYNKTLFPLRQLFGKTNSISNSRSVNQAATSLFHTVSANLFHG
ncbi:hypothetical protein C5Y97_30705 [Blastopirellula marina]|uniref:Uncharacterized protein n=1 Tax=Blastopirellula marina TaxID=124 RepID=A0A2S8F2Y3_9BACT|nr:hypothetical protein C5Y98_30690 [Blastopirellula marina]PTL40822.1 hypothetical protein C5Y97_30705 [Blastopirellula marina]